MARRRRASKGGGGKRIHWADFYPPKAEPSPQRPIQAVGQADGDSQAGAVSGTRASSAGRADGRAWAEAGGSSRASVVGVAVGYSWTRWDGTKPEEVARQIWEGYRPIRDREEAILTCGELDEAFLMHGVLCGS